MLVLGVGYARDYAWQASGPGGFVWEGMGSCVADVVGV